MKAASVPQEKQSIARGSILSLLSMVLSRGASMAHSIVVARWLDPYRVGVYSIVSYVLGLAGAFADIGLPAATMKLVAEYQAGRPRELKSLLQTALLTMAVLAGTIGSVLFVVSGGLATFYREPVLYPLLRVGAILLVLSLFGGLMSGVLQGLQRISLLAILGPTKGAMALLGTVLLLPHFGLMGILAASMMAEVLAFGLAAGPLRAAVALDPADRARFSLPILQRGLAMGIPIFLNSLTLWGTPLLVRSVLAQTKGMHHVGLFQVADSIGRLLLLLPGAVAIPFVPAVSELSAVEPPRVSGLVQSTLRATFLITLPVALFLFLSAEPLVLLVYGSAYEDAGSLGALLVMAGFFQSFTVVIWSLLVGIGRTWAGFLMQLVSQILLITLSLLLIPRFSLLGLGSAYIAASAVCLLLCLVYLVSRLGFTFRHNRPLVLLALLSWSVAWGIHEICGTGLLPAVLLAFGLVLLEGYCLTDEERQYVRGLFRWIPIRMGPSGAG